MDRLEEISKRKLEIKELLESSEENLDLKSLEKELDDLDQEERKINSNIEQRDAKDAEEMRKRQETADNVQGKKLGKEMEEMKMNEERKFTIKWEFKIHITKRF